MDEVPIEMAIFNIYVSLPQGIIYVLYIYTEYIFNIYSSIYLPISSTESNQWNPSNQTKFNPIWVCLKMG